MVYTKKTLSSQNSSNVHFSLDNQNVIPNTNQVFHMTRNKTQTRFNKICSRVGLKLNPLMCLEVFFKG